MIPLSSSIFVLHTVVKTFCYRCLVGLAWAVLALRTPAGALKGRLRGSLLAAVCYDLILFNTELVGTGGVLTLLESTDVQEAVSKLRDVVLLVHIPIAVP